MKLPPQHSLEHRRYIPEKPESSAHHLPVSTTLAILREPIAKLPDGPKHLAKADSTAY